MIIAVAGGKGGVGKTTVAFDLAVRLDGVVVDADLGMADLPATGGPDLHDVLAGRAAVADAVQRIGAARVLPGGRSLAGARACDLTGLVDVVEVLDNERDVVVDCPAGLAADVGIGLYAADALVLVTTPNEWAIEDAVRTRALANELDAGLAAVVVNRAGPNTPLDRVEAVFGAPTVGIPVEDEIARVTATWRPVTKGDAASGFQSLAAHVEAARSR